MTKTQKITTDATISVLVKPEAVYVCMRHSFGPVSDRFYYKTNKVPGKPCVVVYFTPPTEKQIATALAIGYDRVIA